MTAKHLKIFTNNKPARWILGAQASPSNSDDMAYEVHMHMTGPSI